MLDPEPSLIVGLSKPAANGRLLWRCELRLSFLLSDTLTLAHSSGLELEWIAALETYIHPAFLGPVVSWLWSFLVLPDILLNFLFEPCWLG